MTFVWLTARKDWRRIWRNPAQVLIWFGVPLLIGAMIITAFGGRGGPRPQAHVLIADEDGSVLSNFLVGALSQEASGSIIRAEGVEAEEGRKRMRMGGATALLVIPEGFGMAVMREDSTTLTLLLNNAQQFLPEIVEESLTLFADGTFYLQRLVGAELRLIADAMDAGMDSPPDAFVATFAVRINSIVRQVRDHLDPPVIELAVTDPGERGEESGPSFGMLFVPGILFMSLMFMAQGMGDEIWLERKEQTLRRVMTTPRHVAGFLAGKLLAGTVMMGLVSIVGLSAGYLYFRLPAWTLPLAVVWSTLAGLMLTVMMTAIQLFARSQRAGNILTFILIWPLIMMGGSFFPIEALPSWMASIGRLTPNGWALTLLKEILMRDFELLDVGAGFLILLAVIAALFLVGVGRLRGGFAAEG